MYDTEVHEDDPQMRTNPIHASSKEITVAKMAEMRLSTRVPIE
jgi:hypothetical protein